MHGLKNRAIAGILTGNQLSKIASRKLKAPAIRYLSRSLRPSGRDEARFSNIPVSFPHDHQDHQDTVSAILPAVLKIAPHNFTTKLVLDTLFFGSNDKKRPNCPGPKSKAPPTCPPPKPPCPPKCPTPKAPKCPPKPCPPPQTPKCPPKPPKCPPKPSPPPQKPKCPPAPPKCPPKPPKKSCLSVFLPVESVNSVDDFLGSISVSAGEFSASKYGDLFSKSEMEFGGKKSRGKCGKTDRGKKPRGCGSGGKKKNGFKKSKKKDSCATIKRDGGNVKPRKLCGPRKEDDPNCASDRYL